MSKIVASLDGDSWCPNKQEVILHMWPTCSKVDCNNSVLHVTQLQGLKQGLCKLATCARTSRFSKKILVPVQLEETSCFLEPTHFWLEDFETAMSSVMKSPNTRKSFNTWASQLVPYEALCIFVALVSDQTCFKCVNQTGKISFTQIVEIGTGSH